MAPWPRADGGENGRLQERVFDAVMMFGDVGSVGTGAVMAIPT